MSIVLGGAQYEVPGVETVSYRDDPAAVPAATDGSPRTTWVRALVAHTVHGLRGDLKPGGKPSKRAEWYALYQANTARQVSWDFTVDTDGTVAWSNDPVARYTWHGNTVNAYTIGFELVQDADGTTYQATIDSAVRMIDFLTAFFGIQRQTPWRAGKPYAGRIARAQSGNNGRNLVGVYGHRNVWVRNGDGRLEAVRKHGDPGDHLFLALAAAGYETLETELAVGAVEAEDTRVWSVRQEALGFGGGDRDGVPGPRTRAALAAKGYAHGLWVPRP
jgi:hypothetical protein